MSYYRIEKQKTPENNIHIANDSDPLIIPRRPRSGDSAAVRSSPSNSTGCFCAHTSSTSIRLGLIGFMEGLGFRVIGFTLKKHQGRLPLKISGLRV